MATGLRYADWFGRGRRDCDGHQCCQASSVLGATYDVVDDAATVASALTAGNAEVNGAASITTNGGAVDLSFADADSC